MSIRTLLCLWLGLTAVRFVCAAESAAIRIDAFVDGNCLCCHDALESAGGLDLQPFLLGDRDTKSADWDITLWENVAERLRGRQMPPPDAGQPDEAEYVAVLNDLELLLDQHAAENPSVGSVAAIRRMTRTQYQNSIRDLFGINLDASKWLPADSVSHGFDNITVEDLSPLLMNRYLRAASEISRLAIGRSSRGPHGLTVRVPPDRTQSSHVEGMPLGTRGGVWFDHFFAENGEYEFQLRLSRDRDEKVEGLHRPHDMDVLIDGVRRHRFTVRPPKDSRDQESVDRHLKIRLPVESGMHRVAVTFVSQGTGLVETKRQPFDARFNRHRHPRLQPALYQVSLVGPLTDPTNQPTAQGYTKPLPFLSMDCLDLRARTVAGRITADNAVQLAEQMLQPVMRLAYRRDLRSADWVEPRDFFADAFAFELQSNEGDLQDAFDAGMEAALASVLVNPHFLFRIETTRNETTRGESVGPNSPQPVDDFTLASRLSYFIWNSCPDQMLLDVASSGRLSQPEFLRDQVRRMLSDPRSDAITEDFATQWLYLRNLETLAPDLREFPDFDDNLRQAFVAETKALVNHVIRNDRSVLELLQPDRAFLNERLAKHYGIPGVIGSHVRAVPISDMPESISRRRGGILRHGSVLMVTSYATRTSPTMRGIWVLENLLGTPPPPAPPNVPALTEKSTLVASTVRERLRQHREDPACATCHARMDPLGFALENYDAVGRWRDRDLGLPIDSRGEFPDGTELGNVADLETALIARPEMFVTAMTEKLMTFGLGRGVESTDAASLRRIVRYAAQHEYRFSALVEAIATSQPFLMRSQT